ncbi:MAG: glycosyltransferase family 87 protein [Chloroflexota bacterium]
MRTAIILVVGLALIAGAVWLPVHVPVWGDVVMLYAAARGLREGVNLYDPAGQLVMMQAVLPQGAALPLYVYPPWYALGVFFLGWLSPEQAARLWLALNAVMLVASILLLTETWPDFRRVISVAFSFLLLPVLGLLWVGQFAMPVLLGGALFLSGARRRSPWRTAAGLLLMTFKPHVGVLMLALGGLWLLREAKPWSRRAVWFTLAGSAVMLAGSFLYDPRWPSHYLAALRGFGNLSTFVICDLCAGVSTSLVRLFTGQPDTGLAVWVGAGFFVALCGWLLWARTSLRDDLPRLIAISATAILFVNPYLMNYDFVMLLLPLAYVTGHASKKGIVIAAVFFLLPWLGLILGQRVALAFALAVCALTMMVALVITHNREVAPTPA